MKRTNKVALLFLIIMLLLITIFVINKRNKPNTQNNNGIQEKPQEKIGLVIDSLLKDSDDINNYIEGIKFLTKKEEQTEIITKLKYDLFEKVAKLGMLKEYIPNYNQLNGENLEDTFISNSLDEILKNSSNKELLITTVEKYIELKNELKMRYLNYMYLNNFITMVYETDEQLSVTIQGQALLDSNMEKKYQRDLASIRNKPITDYLSYKSEYTAEEYIVFEKSKEIDAILFKLSKIPEIKADTTQLKENLKQITSTSNHPDTKELKTNNNVYIESKVDPNLPVTQVPIEYIVNKKTNKVQLNTKIALLYMRDIGKQYIITEQAQTETPKPNIK